MSLFQFQFHFQILISRKSTGLAGSRKVEHQKGEGNGSGNEVMSAGLTAGLTDLSSIETFVGISMRKGEKD